MKKAVLIFFLLSFFILHCSREKNRLLPAELIMISFVPVDSSLYKIDSSSLYTDNIAKSIIATGSGTLQGKIKITDFIIQKASEGKMKLYDPYLFFNYYENLSLPPEKISNLDIGIPQSELKKGLLKPEEWKRNLGAGLDSTMVDDKIKVWENPMLIEQIKSFFFIEKWKLMTNPLSFEKKILSWSPVRYYEKYYENGSSSGILKKFAFSVIQNPELKINRKMIYAGRFRYEYFLGAEDPANFNFGTPYERKVESHFWSGFSKISLVNTIIELAVTGKVQGFDPDHHSLSVSKIRENLGEGSDSVLVEGKWRSYTKEINTDNILSVIFIEDWYINPDDLQIYKEGLGIAPVQYLQDDTDPDKYKKSIPYILYYKKQAQ